MSAPAASVVVVPGWRDSGEGHWQTLWTARLPSAIRVVQDDWITPTRSAWVKTLESTILGAPHPVVLVASSNDPFCPVRLAGAYARSWGSEFVRLQDAGHINIDSGHGEWPLGWALLQSLVEEQAAAPAEPLRSAA